MQTETLEEFRTAVIADEERQRRLIARNNELLASGSAARAATVAAYLRQQANEHDFVAAEFTSMHDDDNARERLASATTLREAADAIERGEDLT